MKIILIGAFGKMGQAIISLKSDFIITKIGSKNSSHPNEITPHLDSNDLVLDFSTNDAFSINFPKVVKAKKPIVIGITGLSLENLAAIKKASSSIPIFLSSNFSQGIQILKKIIPHLPNHTYQITETHHTEKKDSPSGTALDLEKLFNSPVKIDSKREGLIVGIHKITLQLEHEIIEISHEALDRKAFAKGALLACTFLSNKPAGLYTSIYD